MLTPEQQTLCDARPNAIDPSRLGQLHYLGNYVRRLPNNMARMMENAYDWEHLPHVHASSFSSIALIASGDWGWRAKVGLPGGGEQLIDLIIDLPRHYWVTTVIDGIGQGTEIHTQATKISKQDIEVDVRFYVPDAPDSEETGHVILQYLSDQYRQLYDEDEALMTGRQSALEDRELWRNAGALKEVCVGRLAALDESAVHIVETESGRFCVRRWKGNWIAHSAVCPHLLGPLSGGEIDEVGHITCPWHGYRFDVETGENREGKCKPLAATPDLVERNGALYLKQS